MVSIMTLRLESVNVGVLMGDDFKGKLKNKHPGQQKLIWTRLYMNIKNSLVEL